MYYDSRADKLRNIFTYDKRWPRLYLRLVEGRFNRM